MPENKGVKLPLGKSIITEHGATCPITKKEYTLIPKEGIGSGAYCSECKIVPRMFITPYGRCFFKCS